IAALAHAVAGGDQSRVVLAGRTDALAPVPGELIRQGGIGLAALTVGAHPGKPLRGCPKVGATGTTGETGRDQTDTEKKEALHGSSALVGGARAKAPWPRVSVTNVANLSRSGHRSTAMGSSRARI